jgi:hypothetical protein
MPKGILELSNELKNTIFSGTTEISDLNEIHEALDTFYMHRIGVFFFKLLKKI